jgi:hypothetical protein
MAGILPWVPRLNITKTIAVTPTISTSAYTSGDQIGGIMTLSNVIRQDSQMNYGNNEIVSVTILDADKQNAAMDIWFFNQSPTVTSTDNAAFAMTAANQAAQCIGVVSIGSSYSSAAAVSTSSDKNLNLPLQVPGTVASPSNVYAIAIVRAAPTYTTTTSLQFQFSFFVD